MWQEELEQLRSPDAEVRRRAIIALGRTKDRRVLNALAEVYHNDPDPALRELARKAGRYIQMEAGDTPATLESLLTTPQAEPEQAAHDQPPVSGAMAQLARGYFDRALDYQVRGDNVKAVELLGKALETNPAIRQDKMVVSLAMDMTGLGSSAAISTLMNPGSRHDLMQRLMGGAVAAGKRVIVEESRWSDALIDLTIYGLVNGAIVFVVALVASEVLFSLISVAFVNAPSVNPGSSQALLSSLNTQQITLPLAALYGLATGVTAVIMLLIADGAIHVIATTVLGGLGTLAGLIRKTTLFYTAMTAISLVLNIGVMTLALNASSDMLAGLIWLPNIVSLVMIFWVAKLIGDAYDFGTAKGCAAIFLGYFGLVLLIVCATITLSAVLASTMQTLVR